MSWFDHYPKEVVDRIESGEVIEQSYSGYIKELNSFSDERLDSVALICGRRKLTYRKMFQKWERYAGVISGLGIKEENSSRVGLLADVSIESVCLIYSLNLAGVSVSMVHGADLLSHDRFEAAVLKEGITDLILPSGKATLEMMRNITEKKDKTSLRNVIIFYSPEVEKGNSPARKRHEDAHYGRLHRFKDVLFMEELLEQAKEKTSDEEARFEDSSKESREAAIIFHTSGTTSGIHKPVPLSDRAFNESTARLLRDERFHDLNSVVTFMAMAPFAVYAACDMMHLPLSYGGTVVLINTGLQNINTLKEITRNKISIVMAGTMTIQMLSSLPFSPDLSSVEMLILGGGGVSESAKKRIKNYLKRCGSHAKLYVGYGLTETGGAVFLSEPDDIRDNIGRPLSGVDVKIYDEDEDRYYDLTDGERVGVLCIKTASLSRGEFNGTTFFELVDIDGEKYLNTYDLVEVDKNGDLRVIGRMNKFFVNNEGIRFDAGLVETAVESQPGIEACGLVPWYHKLLHDTVPILYVKTDGKGKEQIGIVRDALYNVFVRDGKIVETNLPSKAVITERLPLTASGKVDVHQIQKENTKGDEFRVEPVRRHEELVGVKLIPLNEHMAIRPGGVPDELESELELLKRSGGLGGENIVEKRFIGGPAEEGPGRNAGPEIDPRSIMEMLRNGALEPEMLGRMLARMLKDDTKPKKRKHKRDMDSCYRGLWRCCADDEEYEDED